MTDRTSAKTLRYLLALISRETGETYVLERTCPGDGGARNHVYTTMEGSSGLYRSRYIDDSGYRTAELELVLRAVIYALRGAVDAGGTINKHGQPR